MIQCDSIEVEGSTLYHHDTTAPAEEEGGTTLHHNTTTAAGVETTNAAPKFEPKKNEKLPHMYGFTTSPPWSAN